MIHEGLNNLERACLEAFRADPDRIVHSGGESTSDWISFGLHLLLESGRLIRAARLASFEGVDFKSDGSPVTLLEEEIEGRLRDHLRGFNFEAVVVGEETGGDLSPSGVAVAIDPVDGTWAFLSRTETITTTLAVFRDGLPFVGMISNPATGEIAYATSGNPTRLVQLSIFGEADSGTSMPLPGADSADALVNVHPSRAAAPLVANLYAAWQRDSLRMVRSPGGSPSWALLEAAKGSFVYVNLWTKRPAEAFDLAAGVLLVEGAGGRVTDLDGESIDPVRHAGPFVAGVDAASQQKVIEIARQG